ncbi:MAG: ABC transporter permease, partial [Phycisphaerales bacterium]|nr:ABC transporter permease [Phycisphaerales bacterium]
LLVFFAFEVLLTGSLPVTVLLFPLFFVPLCMFALGSIWFLSALGAFTRDVAHLMITFVPLLIFASPVFYMPSDFPANIRFVFYLNPLSPFIEMARDILLVGAVPHPLTYLVACAIAVVMFYGGYSFFMRYRSVVVDVL